MRHRSGFTLLEVVIAVSLLAVGLVAVMGLLNRSLGLHARARELRLDAEMAAEVAGTLELAPGGGRDEAQREILERYAGRVFRIQSKSTPYAEVEQLELQIFRGREAKGEPAYRLSKFSQAKEES